MSENGRAYSFASGTGAFDSRNAFIKLLHWEKPRKGRPSLIRAFILTLLFAAPAAANPIADVICDDTPRMTTKLERQLRAEKQSIGLRGPEQVVEVWTDERGDWTMVITYASGKSCIVAMGEAWIDLPRKDPA